MLLNTSVNHPLLLLRNITLCKYTTIGLSTTPLVNIWIFSPRRGAGTNRAGLYTQGCFLCTQIFHSVQFSRSVVSDSLWPHEPQHARHPCPSPTPGVHPSQCRLSWWCHPTISSSAIPFSSCPQSFAASGSFPISQPFTSGGQSIGISASTSVLPMNTQDWSPLE